MTIIFRNHFGSCLDMGHSRGKAEAFLIQYALVLCVLFSALPAEAQDTDVKAQLDTTSIREPEMLEEAVVTSFVEAAQNSTQTGLARIDPKALNSGFAFMSSPDIIKTLQMLPGVASGTELISGLYVHGGTGSDNLFTLDGVPIYQVSHLAGLFSSFNTDLTESVEFYKSGFPARYGSKLSSVVDIRTKDGDFEEYHGSFSIGLIDGRLSYGGPIVKGRTSFNLGVRTSWLDVVSLPALAIINAVQKGEKKFARYAFWDANAKLTHKFSENSRLSLNFYMGRDALNFRLGSYSYDDTGERVAEESIGTKVNWGNILTSLDWKARAAENLYSDVRLYWSNYRGMMSFSTEMDSGSGRYSDESRNYSRISDMGLDAGFTWIPGRIHRVRFGLQAVQHWFRPERYASKDSHAAGMRYNAFEPAIHIEDEITPAEWLGINVGIRYSMFATGSRIWHSIEPRAAFRFTISPAVSLKASYAEMSQPIHQVATNYLDLPSNLWMPSTERMSPMRSRQVAGGAYLRLPYGIRVTAEGWWKTMEHLYEYVGANAFYPPLDQWETSFAEGLGRSWGMELETGWGTDRADISVAYTLSWNRRYFEAIYHTWYPDRNDNRHKITVMGTYRFSERFECYAAWNWKTGNRMTVESYSVPSSNPYNESDKTLYFAPNNALMPDYHRLDIGMNFRKTTRRGNESIWNLSIYNVYCRMNPFMAYVTTDENGKMVGEATGVIPIIPSFSYTLKF